MSGGGGRGRVIEWWVGEWVSEGVGEWVSEWVRVHCAML